MLSECDAREILCFFTVAAHHKPIFDFRLFNEGSTPQTMDLLQASQNGLVIELHRHPLEQLQMAAEAFILREVYKDMFRWGETDRVRLAIVLDEAHRICRDTTLPKIMKEGRKFGIAVISASQGLNDFHPDVLGNVGTKIVFRTNYPASRKVSGFLKTSREQDSADTVEQLELGSAFVQTPEMRYALSILSASSANRHGPHRSRMLSGSTHPTPAHRKEGKLTNLCGQVSQTR